jgi:hypothetical protein
MTPKPITATGNGSTGIHGIGSGRRHDRYNRSLVNRIEDLMDPSFLMDWKILLEENNRGKERPYIYNAKCIHHVPCKAQDSVQCTIQIT